MLTHKQNLDRFAADHCIKLFSHYDIEIQCGVADDSLVGQKFLVCGVIAFTSKHMRGSLALAITREPLEQSCPAIVGAGTGSHRDWVCELANQLLGRVKNQLLSHSVEIYQSTPVAVAGQHLCPIQEHRPIAALFTAGAGVVCVWTDCEFDAQFELSEPSEAPCTVGDEGDILFF